MKSVWNTYFFARQTIAKTFLSYLSPTQGILHAEFGLVWTAPWPDQTDTRSDRPIFKIPYSRNSKSSVWNLYEILTFLLGKLYQFFLCYTLLTQEILHTEFRSVRTTFWPNEKDLFLKFPFCEIQKVPYEILTFFY